MLRGATSSIISERVNSCGQPGGNHCVVVLVVVDDDDREASRSEDSSELVGDGGERH